MHGHQGGGAGGVHRHGLSFQAEEVRHAARDHAGVGPVALERRDVLGDAGDARTVVVVHHAGEHAGLAAPQRGRVDPGTFDGFPGHLQQQPLLWVHRHRLMRGDTEEPRVEFRRLVEESALPGVRGAGVLGVRVVQRVQVPATVVGELRNAVGPGGDRFPQFLRRGHPTGIAARHSYDGDRLRLFPLGFGQPGTGIPKLGRCPLEVLEQLSLVVRHRIPLH